MSLMRSNLPPEGTTSALFPSVAHLQQPPSTLHWTPAGGGSTELWWRGHRQHWRAHREAACHPRWWGTWEQLAILGRAERKLWRRKKNKHEENRVGGYHHVMSLSLSTQADKPWRMGLFELITNATQVFPFHSSSLYFFSGSKLVHC